MLNSYTIIISGNSVGLDNLEYAIVMMSDYKQRYKEELRLKGVRRNWFPLVLLHKYRNSYSELNNSDISSIRVFYRKLLKEDKYTSFYLDNYSRVGNMISIGYRANECMTETIKKIAQIYGLSV